MDSVTTGQAILIVLSSVQTLLLIPIGIYTMKNSIATAEHKRTLYGNGIRGLCGDVDSHRKALGTIEKNCVLHHGEDTGSGDRKVGGDMRDLIRKIAVELVEAQQAKTQGA